MKLGRFAIMMIGILFCVGFLSWGIFYNMIPNNAEVKLLQKAKDDNNEQASLMPGAKKRVEQAKQMVTAKGKAWSAYVATRTPPTNLRDGGIDLSVNAWQLAVDTPKFRDSIQRAVNAQVKKGGVKVVNAPMVPVVDSTQPANEVLSSFYNYPAIKFPVVIFDFGTITVQGTYKQITDNVRAYKSMPHYLAVADGLRIDGTSPNLTGTYNLSIVGFIRSKTIPPAVNEGAAAASTGLGGGGMGGGSPFGPGGMGGGRPGGGGGPALGKKPGFSGASAG